MLPCNVLDNPSGDGLRRPSFEQQFTAVNLAKNRGELHSHHLELEMEQSLGEESLPEEDAAMGEAPVRGVETSPAEHDTVGYILSYFCVHLHLKRFVPPCILQTTVGTAVDCRLLLLLYSSCTYLLAKSVWYTHKCLK